jgi:hypothetical protein
VQLEIPRHASSGPQIAVPDGGGGEAVDVPEGEAVEVPGGADVEDVEVGGADVAAAAAVGEAAVRSHGVAVHEPVDASPSSSPGPAEPPHAASEKARKYTYPVAAATRRTWLTMKVLLKKEPRALARRRPLSKAGAARRVLASGV